MVKAVKNDGSKIEIQVPNRMRVRSGAKGVILPVSVLNDVLQESGKGKGAPYGATIMAFLGTVEGGKYNAPSVDKTVMDQITVYSRFNSQKSKTFEIEVELDPLKIPPTPKALQIHVPANLETISEGKIPLTVSVENDFQNKGVDFFPEQGKVEEGNFIAPRVDEDLSVKIRVISKADPSKSEEINILVKTVEIQATVPSIIHTGGQKVDFHIQTLNDPSGNLKNFTCRIVSGKGELTSNGVYVPPANFRAVEDVVFQVRSTYTGRELEFRFELHPPLCNICNAWEVDPATGDCPDCGAINYSRTAAQFKCKGCGQPLVPGESCKKCGYPKASILRFF